MKLLNALMHSFIHSFNRYLQNAYGVPGRVLGARDEMTNISDTISVLMELTV